MEVKSAYDSRKPLLPVVIESDYVPLEFIRFVLTGVQHIQLYNDSQVEDAAERLTEQLRRYGAKRESEKINRFRPLKSVITPYSNSPTFKSVKEIKGHRRSRSDLIVAYGQVSQPTRIPNPTGGSAKHFQ